MLAPRTMLGLWVLSLLQPLAGCKHDGKAGSDPGPARPAASTAVESEPSEKRAAAPPRPEPRVPELSPAPAGLPARPSPAYNPTTPAKVALGELLFFDPRLSSSGERSCSSCHQPDHGFSSPRARTRTASDRLNARHTPTLWNTAHAESWPWDGAEDTLEGQILAHAAGQLGRPLAMGIAAIGHYPGYFERFGMAALQPNGRGATEALAAFVRTLEAGNAPWDRYERGERDAVSEEAVAGYNVFRNRAQCALCHPPPLYTDHRFHALQIADDRADPGRARITRKPADAGAFRTPPLRGLAHTAPYLHDGSADSLEEVIDRKLGRGELTGDPQIDQQLARSPLSDRERQQLLAFLRALSRERLEPRQPPELPQPPTADDLPPIPFQRPSVR